MTQRKKFALALAVCQALIILPLLFGLLQHTPTVYALDWYVNTFADVTNNSCDPTCSLRDAIALAEANDTIYLPAGSYVLSSQFSVGKTINLVGAGATAADTIIDGDGQYRLFNLTAGTVTFTNLTLQNGRPASGNGGAILAAGTSSVTLNNTVITNSVTVGHGGGIYLAEGTLNVLNGSQIVSNTAVVNSNGGGGIYSNQGTINLTSSTVANNIAQYGGGIYVNLAAAQLTINDSHILSNQGLAEGLTIFPGGGIHIGAGSGIMHSGLISGNTAHRGAGVVLVGGDFVFNDGLITNNEANYGGGIYVRSTTALLTINGGSISRNHSKATGFGGGGLYIFQGHAVQNGGEITNNTAVANSGALQVAEGSFTMNGGLISGNSAGEKGGAIYNDRGTLTINNGMITNNSSGLTGGGAIATGADSHNSVSNTVIYQNSAPGQSGGGIYNTGTLTLTNVTLSGNQANSGGGLHNQGSASLSNVTVYENTAVANGGGLHGSSGTLTVVNSIIASNSAPTGPDCAGTLVSQGYNLIQDSANCTVSGSTTGNIGGDPLLEPLALNGGATLNHALAVNSPALDAGNNAVCAAVDQRGAFRPLDGDGVGGAICDMGAFEYGPTSGLSIADASLSEGDSGTKTISFTVSLFPASGSEITVSYASSNETAVAPTDYTTTSGTLTFAPLETQKTITVTVNGDTTDEWDETFLVTLNSPTPGILLNKAVATGTILNDDISPSLNIAGTSVTEGNSGTTTAVFTVILSAESGKAVTVTYATVDGTAVAPTDYTATSGTLNFAPLQTEKTITVTVNGDETDEDDETFLVNLSSPSNATISGGQATGTILNDDSPPSLSIADTSVTEGNSGTATAVFTVTLSAASSKTVAVDFATLAGSATAGVDYAITSGSLTFTPGTLSQTITVQVYSDTVDEDDETFSVKLSAPVNATLGNDEGEATIIDDDDPPTISIANASVTEGDSGTSTAVFTINLSQASSKIITVEVNSTDGSATAGEDYTAVSTSLTFHPGSSLSQTVSVTIHGDTLKEADETFYLTLSSPTNATLGQYQATGTVLDDDGFFIYLPFVIRP